MIKHIFVIAQIMLLLAATPAISSAGTPSYLCVAERATGFRFKDGKWLPDTFNVSDRKYVLSRNDDSWHWKQLGYSEQAKYPSQCKEQANGYFACEFAFRKVTFNNQTMKFQIYTEGTYVVHEAMVKELQVKKHNDTYIEIGNCAHL